MSNKQEIGESKDISQADKTLISAIDSDVLSGLADASILSFGIVWHPDFRRIGAIAPVHFDRLGTAELSRSSPNFDDHDSPLLDQHISRSPIVLERKGAADFVFIPSPSKMSVEINGRPLDRPMQFNMHEIGNEIIISLGNTVILSLFRSQIRTIGSRRTSRTGLLGISQLMAQVRDSIDRVARSRLPVLILGETGTGKELAAQALHSSSDRAGNIMISANMAAITPSLAAAQLFGARKGAFTGAVESSAGLFLEADGGTLFLDEIGDAPEEVQSMLLRALETRQISAVGEGRSRDIDVRVIAASDKQIDANDGDISFNQALLQRLAGARIEMPPLRLRRIDIGILIRHFLQDPSDALPQVSAAGLPVIEVHRMALRPWPGNVRELFNAVRRLRLGEPIATAMPATGFRPTGQDARYSEGQTLASSRTRYRDPLEVSDHELLQALNRCNWVIKDAARVLNVSRTSLYELMERSEAVNSVENVSDERIMFTIDSVDGGLDEWARELRVGRDALRKRVAQLDKD